MISESVHVKQTEDYMKNIVQTDKAPKAIGPYSQAISTDRFVFTSGQVPIDPGTGRIVDGGIKEQTRRVMENLRSVLAAAGTEFSKVVKTMVFLNDIKDFSLFNEIYSEYFDQAPPARSTVQVAALPLNALVEIEMIAIVE